MKTRHIFLLAAVALTLSLLFVGQAASKPGPLNRDQIQNLSQSSTPDGFDVRDALIGAAAGIGIAIFGAGLFVAASRSRRAQVAL